MAKNLRPTLRQVFGFSLLGLLLSLALLFYLVLNGSQRTILQSAERLQDLASQDVAQRVSGYLNEAPLAIDHFEKQIQHALVDPRKIDSIQAALLSLLLSNENISEASFTFADSTGFAPDGSIKLIQSSAGEVTAFRASEGSQFVSKRTWFDGKRFVSQSSTMQEGASRNASSAGNEMPAVDPTAHLTFQTPASKDFYGQLLWTDLHWSQLDEALPKERRRVEVSAQKAINDSHSQFSGVLRVGLLERQINRAVQIHLTDASQSDPHLIFLCDNQGRLITGFGGREHFVDSAGDLRLVPGNIPPQVTLALQQPSLKTVSSDQPVAASEFQSGSITYLYTFRALRETQDWIVGIVVPRDYYLGALLQIRQQVLLGILALISGIIVIGGLIVHGIGRAHAMIVRETTRMMAFEFSASNTGASLRDVEEVLIGLEKAKTAMRAMGKYVPIDLVRRLYCDGSEPVLGGESIELSVLFTDIKEFTAFAEQTDPDTLAKILGRYLGVMATVIQNDKGTIDKYIGDSVMAFWNAPEAVTEHSILACRAALKCRVALRDLYASPAWGGSSPFETRFGLHRCFASVGHFGSPDRFNYTAVGDGINLASRLEGLNKHYGTTIIASETIHSEAQEEFVFRLLDRVSVKGKTQGVTIYELAGEKAADGERPPHIVSYEQAFESYQRARFKEALDLLEGQPGDPPSMMLANRCRCLIERPPGGGWNGIHVFASK